MALVPGARLGPYEIVSAIGAGGMGEVYRARDTKLQRDVAIKVLPALFASDPERLARFEREARAVAALSHPGILAIYDFGQEGHTTYAVMELLEGGTLRTRLEGGALPPRKAIDIAAQIARALGAAHDKGVVHRDVKPENIFVTTDGRVKILDFGLARLADGVALAGGSSETRIQTTDGVILGTVGYMSPEQVRGLPADYRSDIFSFGIVLYEMLTGARPFGGDSAVETMNAILKEDPPALVVPDASLAPGLRRTVEHCLEKEPAERFQSARDIAFGLDALKTASSDTGAARPGPGRARRRIPLFAAAALGLLALAAGLLAGRVLWARASSSAPALSFTRLTYDRGTIWNARFAPDGETILYDAAWNGKPIRIALSRADRYGSTTLSLPDAAILAVSSKGELALSLGHAFEGWMGEGTLARAPILGGVPRPIAEHVREADWMPDGSDLAIVRRVDQRERLEFPIGKVLYETSGYISHMRVSPDGRRIAFADHPQYADDNGDVAVVDLQGTRTTLATGFQGLRGLCWTPDGREIWFTADGTPSAGVALRAVTLEKATRPLFSMPGDWRLYDIGRDGRALIVSERVFRHIELHRSGQAEPQDISMLEQAMGSAISDDGQSVLITDQSNESGARYGTFLRRASEPEAIRLGPGQAFGFSPDGRFALTVLPMAPSRIMLLPIGAGQPRELPNPAGLTIQVAAYVADGKRVVMIASDGTQRTRGYIQNIEDGAIKPFTPPGVTMPSFFEMPTSADDSRVILLGPDGLPHLFPLNGGSPEPLPMMTAADYPVGWSSDGRSVYVTLGFASPTRIYRVDLVNRTRTLWKEIQPSQSAGVRLSQVLVTPDGGALLHSYSQLLSTLYVVNGLAPAAGPRAR